jgi:hypothetical protein
MIIWSVGLTRYYRLIAILDNDRYQLFQCRQDMLASSGLRLLIINWYIGLTISHKLMPAATHFEFS